MFIGAEEPFDMNLIFNIITCVYNLQVTSWKLVQRAKKIVATSACSKMNIYLLMNNYFCLQVTYPSHNEQKLLVWQYKI